MRAFRFLWLMPLALSACVSPPLKEAPPQRPAPPAPRPMPQPVPPAPVNWADRTPAPGVWAYSQDARGSIAMFGVAGSDALFTLRCDRSARRIYASRPGAVAGRMTLRSTTGARFYDALPTGAQPPYVAATLAPGDPHLDALAFSRGRILISLDGAEDIILPVWPELTRVVEDCRG
jgi:hypothetical protein